MKLDSKVVHDIFLDCLFKEGEDTSTAVIVEGILDRFGFHPERLQSHKLTVAGMLDELPDEFKAHKGGGMSFLNACVDKHGNHWAEHVTMDQLFCLGMALDLVKCLLPRQVWAVFPGGMPYYAVK